MVCIFFLPGTKGDEANKRRRPEAGTHMWNLGEVWRKDLKGSVSPPHIYHDVERKCGALNTSHVPFCMQVTNSI